MKTQRINNHERPHPSSKPSHDRYNHQNHRGRGSFYQKTHHRQQTSYSSDRTDGGTCYNCGGIGHFSSKFLSKPNTNASSRGRNHHESKPFNNRFKLPSFNGSQANHVTFEDEI